MRPPNFLSNGSTISAGSGAAPEPHSRIDEVSKRPASG